MATDRGKNNAYVADHPAKKSNQLSAIVFTPEEFSHPPAAGKRQLWNFMPARNLPRLRTLGVIDTLSDGRTGRSVRFQ